MEENKNRTLITASRIVSAVFNPFIIPFLAFLSLFLFSIMQVMLTQYKLFVLGIVFCFTILLPMFTIYLFQKINHLNAQELGYRKRRFFPLILTLISYVFCLLMLYKLNVPQYMSGIILTAIVIMVILMLTNFGWRVSEHTAGMGAIIGGLICFSLILNFNPVWLMAFFILISGLVGSARIISGNHSFGEVIFGFIIGFACSMIILHPITNFYFRYFFR